MKRLADGLLRWACPHPEWRAGDFGAEVASFALRADDEGLLIDPLLPADDGSVLPQLDALFMGAERVSILITIPYHARSSEELAPRFGAQIYGPAGVAKRLSSSKRFTAIEPGDELPGGARSFAIGKPRPRGEQPLWLPSHRALAFGDAVVEYGGSLRVWAHDHVDEKVRRFYRERFNPTLRPLLELDTERVLVTHGEPVLSGGGAALRRALDAEPWYHHG
ncbi:MAG: MBL fold metallo-hydrolase [Actinomycetota bacterium]